MDLVEIILYLNINIKTKYKPNTTYAKLKF